MCDKRVDECDEGLRDKAGDGKERRARERK
jgi:hypothetical protein